MMNDQPFIRVLIVDDQTIIREGTRALLERVDHIKVIGQASNGADAVALAAQLQPDVVLLDLVMPGSDGITTTHRIVRQNSRVRVIGLSGRGSEEQMLAVMRAGALGYVLKESDPAAMVQAIHQVARGEPWLPPAMAHLVTQRPEGLSGRHSDISGLTEREVRVLQLLARGKTNAQIAAELQISDNTARTHVSRILDKLHCTNRVQATLYALRSGLVEPMGAEET